MSAKIVFDKGKIDTTVGNIKKLANDISELGNQLVTQIDSSTSEWDGAVKNEFMNVIDQDLKPELTTNMANRITEIANILNKNYEAMQDADNEIATKLRSK